MCQTCQALSDALYEAASRLSIASVHMHEVSGQGKPELFNAAMLAAQSVRKECEALKSQLDRHKAEHQLFEKSKAAGAS
jgi:hypothetical protein